ncbi:hypothetical protein LTR86_010402 [Recurvomyces mirabilis]|nr:hypothetical protein LTR86_010402 [Recurvomyces mirabilis]
MAVTGILYWRHALENDRLRASHSITQVWSIISRTFRTPEDLAKEWGLNQLHAPIVLASDSRPPGQLSRRARVLEEGERELLEAQGGITLQREYTVASAPSTETVGMNPAIEAQETF